MSNTDKRIKNYTENALRMMLEDGDSPFSVSALRKELRGREKRQAAYDSAHDVCCYCMECM